MLAEEILHILEEIFSRRIFDAICEKITVDFFGNEMDVRTALVNRPDLFERAFLAMFGNMGIRILEHVCSELREEFGLDKGLSYSGKGDFAKFMRMKAMGHDAQRLVRI